MIKIILFAGVLVVAACAKTATCYNEHGHQPDDHHPECNAPLGVYHSTGTTTPPIVEPPPVCTLFSCPPPPPPPTDDCTKPNSGRGNGDECGDPGKSEGKNKGGDE